MELAGIVIERRDLISYVVPSHHNIEFIITYCAKAQIVTVHQIQSDSSDHGLSGDLFCEIF